MQTLKGQLKQKVRKVDDVWTGLEDERLARPSAGRHQQVNAEATRGGERAAMLDERGSAVR